MEGWEGWEGGEEGWEGCEEGCEWGGRGVRRVDIRESECVMCVERSELVMY